MLDITAGGGAAASTGTVTVTASNTGVNDINLVNGAVSGDGSISSASFSGKTGVANTVSFDGVADTINVTGGAGNDTVDFITTNTFLTGSFSLGAGTDTVDFTNYAATGDNKATYDGLVINLGSGSVSFDAGTATAASVGGGKVVGYDVDAASTLTNTDAKGSTFTLSSVESVIGTAAADYIVANNEGTQIQGGTGADTIVLGTDADKYVLTAADQGGTAGVNGGGDAVSAFTSTSDKVSINGALETALDDITADGSLVFVSAASGAGVATAANITTTAEAIAILGAENGSTAVVTAANLGDLTKVAALLEQEITLTAAGATTDDALIIIEASDTTGTFGIYSFTETATAADDDIFNAAELTLLGIVTGDAIVTTDIEII